MRPIFSSKQESSISLDSFEDEEQFANSLTYRMETLERAGMEGNYKEFEGSQGNFDSMVSSSQDRELEDVDYWRHRAGWFDDDGAMKDYNQGVYDTFYSTDDKVGSNPNKRSAASQIFSFFGSSQIISTSMKVFGGIVGVTIMILLVRALRRRSQSRKKNRKISSLDPESSARSSNRRSTSRSRSRSKSKLGRSRSSRSRSRRRKSQSEKDLDEEEKGYSLMEDGDAKTSSKSRSKSRDKSRSRRRSRSRSRAARRDSARETMLV